MFSKSITYTSSSLSDVHFVAGTAFNRTHHVFSDTGIVELDRNVSSGSNSRGRHVGNIAEGKKEK